MSAVAGVRQVTVGTAADDATAGSWDLVLVVRLDGPRALPAYRNDPGHRAYVDDYLRPKMASIAAWNFAVP
jgi:hypothetical protein